MAEDKNLLKTFQQYSELCHETCIDSLDFASSYWDENMNTMKKQIEFWTTMDTDFKKYLDRVLKKMPFEPMKKEYIRDEDNTMVHKSIAKLIEANKDYLSYLTRISDIIAKEQLKAMRKNAEKGFSIFGAYMKSFSG